MAKEQSWYEKVHESSRLYSSLQELVKLAKFSRQRDYVAPKTRILNVEVGMIWTFCNDSMAKRLNCHWKGIKVTL